MAQTAVEWLAKKFEECELMYGTIQSLIHKQYLDGIIKQAKQMEKKQHEQTWNAAHQAGRFEGKGIAEENWQTFKQYYNETFGNITHTHVTSTKTHHEHDRGEGQRTCHT